MKGTEQPKSKKKKWMRMNQEERKNPCAYGKSFPSFSRILCVKHGAHLVLALVRMNQLVVVSDNTYAISDYGREKTTSS